MEALVVQARKEKQERPLYSRLPSSSQQYPWLMISHGIFKERHTFFSLLENHYYTRIVPELSNKYVWCSSYGWWVVQDCYTNQCFLLEPLSLKKILLPPLDIPVCEPNKKRDVDCNLCVLSAAPNDPNCCVLFFSSVAANVVFCCQPGDDNFVKHKLQDNWLAAATIHGGSIYGLMGANSSLVKITFVDKKIEFMQVMTLEQIPRLLAPQENTFFQDYLVESCGELLLVHKILSLPFAHAIETIDFKVFRLLDSESSVVELKNIGDRAIFLDERSGMSCASSHKNGGNRIYFTKFRNVNLYEYDLRDRSISLSLPCPTVSHRDSSIFNWVMMPLNTQ